MLKAAGVTFAISMLERVIEERARGNPASADAIRKAAGGPIRFWHLDGDHARDQLLLDLDLAAATLHPQGIICLDDMLHPGYPLLVVAVHEWLERHPDWRVLCVIDREDIVAAAKFGPVPSGGRGRGPVLPDSFSVLVIER